MTIYNQDLGSNSGISTQVALSVPGNAAGFGTPAQYQG